MPAIDDDDCSELSSHEDERLLPQTEGDRDAAATKIRRKRFAHALTLAAAAVFGCLAVATVRLPVASQKAKLRGPQNVTARSLLEGQELTDLATDNLLALSGDALRPLGREGVRAEVAQRLHNVSEVIRTHLPEVHQELETVQLSGEQKEAALAVLRKLGDPRMVSITRDINAVLAETPDGDFQRRLSDKLGPRASMLQELAEEMFPSRKFSVNMEKEVPGIEKWHPKLEVDFSSPTARRLAEQEEGVIDAGVRTQARTLFASLNEVLGDKMQPVHARQLLSLFSDDDSKTSTGGASGTGKPGFMDCVMKAVPNPMKVAKCISDNMGEVVSMMSKFLKGKR